MLVTSNLSIMSNFREGCLDLLELLPSRSLLSRRLFSASGSVSFGLSRIEDSEFRRWGRRSRGRLASGGSAKISSSPLGGPRFLFCWRLRSSSEALNLWRGGGILP